MASTSCFITSVSFGQEEAVPPTVNGFVTRVTSPTDFDINGHHVLIKGTALIDIRSGKSVSSSTTPVKPDFGEEAKVYGEYEPKVNAILATHLIFDPIRNQLVEGSAIIDAVPALPAASAVGSDHLVRADGYSILITKGTQTIFTPPLAAAEAFHTNIWIKFHGTQRPDGIVVADKVTLTQNIVGKGEAKLLDKNEYDPAKVDPAYQQGPVSKAIIGIDYKKIPPYTDVAMQARISAIGAKLVPTYQRLLAKTDDSRLDFRFQLVDESKWPDAITLPSGIILVPRQVVERLQNDSQVATVLADNIATALEKQSYKAQPANRAIAGTAIAGEIGGAFLPGLGLVTGVGAGVKARELARLREDQSGRVSLCLLHDAGYDIHEAPLAWWYLASKKKHTLADIPMPPRAANLYRMLGTTWLETDHNSLLSRVAPQVR